jgi:hypothetical protein
MRLPAQDTGAIHASGFLLLYNGCLIFVNRGLAVGEAPYYGLLFRNKLHEKQGLGLARLGMMQPNATNG